MAGKKGNKLPDPPVDLASRRLPSMRISREVYRIHHTGQEPLYFGRTNTQRFDDPLREYGVFYAALQPEGAFAEVFLRELSMMLIREKDLEERALAQIVCQGLKCVDLSAAGLRKVSCDNRISTEKPYAVAGSWSRAFFEHPMKPDGIIYRSRHNPRFRCLAIFERGKDRVKVKKSEPLMLENRRACTLGQVDRYQLALEANL